MKAPKKKVAAAAAPAPAKALTPRPAPKVKGAVAAPLPKPKPVNAAFKRVHELVMRFVGNKNDNAELSMRQLAVLTTIRIGAVAPGVREISTAMGVNKPTITRAMDRLEALGLIERYADENDRRLVIAALTPKGDDLVAVLETVP